MDLTKTALQIEKRPTISPIEKIARMVRERGDDIIYRNRTTNFDFSRITKSVNKCGHRVETVSTNAGEIVTRKNVCNQPFFCPVCADSRTKKRYYAAKPSLKRSLRQKDFLYLVTFTVENTADPYDVIDRLNQGLRAFYLQGQKEKGRRRSGEWSKVRGAYLNFEAKYGDGKGLAHIHAHALVSTSSMLDYRVYNTKAVEYAKRVAGRDLTDEEMKFFALDIDADGKAYSKIQREWMRATGYTGVSIHVRPIRSASLADCYEAFKYPSKLADFNNETPERIAEMYDALRGHRLFRAYGEYAPRNSEKVTEEEFAGVKVTTRAPKVSDKGIEISFRNTYRFAAGDVYNDPGFIPFSSVGEGNQYAAYIRSGWYDRDNKQRGRLLADYNAARKFIFDVMPKTDIVQELKRLYGMMKGRCRQLADGYVDTPIYLLRQYMDGVPRHLWQGGCLC